MWSLYPNVRGPLTSPTRSTLGFLAHPSLDLTMRKSLAQRWIVETPREYIGQGKWEVVAR